MNRAAIKRICSLLLCLVMSFSLLPTVLAAQAEPAFPAETDVEDVPGIQAVPEEEDPFPMEATPETRDADKDGEAPETTSAPVEEADMEAGEAAEDREIPEETPAPAEEADTEAGEAAEDREIPEETPAPAEEADTEAGETAEDRVIPEGTPAPAEEADTEPEEAAEEREIPEETPVPAEEEDSGVEDSAEAGDTPEETAAVKSSGNTYTVNGVKVHYDDFASIPHECWTYANNMYHKIWGKYFTNSFDDVDNSLRKLSDSELTLTVEHLKAYVSAAALGSCLRICNGAYLHGDDGWGHSQIIVSKDANGFTVLEGGLTDYPYCQEAYYTWSKYVSTAWLGGKYAYIKYIKWPGASPYTPSLSAPSVGSIQNVNGGISITWNAVSGAAKYAVYRRIGNGDCQKYTVCAGTSYTDTHVNSGSTYSYFVRCVGSDGSYLSDLGRGRSIYYVASPRLVSIQNSDGGVTITWAKSLGAAKYAVLRKSSGGNWGKYTVTDSTSYTDRNVNSGAKYSYTVRALNSAGAYCSGYNNIGLTITYVAVPVLQAIANTSSGVKLTWGAVAGAAKYAVYRKAAGESRYTRYTVTSSTTYTDKNAVNGTFYYYRIWCLDASGRPVGNWSIARGITCSRSK